MAGLNVGSLLCLISILKLLTNYRLNCMWIRTVKKFGSEIHPIRAYICPADYMIMGAILECTGIKILHRSPELKMKKEEKNMTRSRYLRNDSA